MLHICRGVVTGATEPNLAPDADPLAPEDTKSNSKQLKLNFKLLCRFPGVQTLSYQ